MFSLFCYRKEFIMTELIYETVEFDEELYRKNIQENEFFDDDEDSLLSPEDVIEKEEK